MASSASSPGPLAPSLSRDPVICMQKLQQRGCRHNQDAPGRPYPPSTAHRTGGAPDAQCPLWKRGHCATRSPGAKAEGGAADAPGATGPVSPSRRPGRSGGKSLLLTGYPYSVVSAVSARSFGCVGSSQGGCRLHPLPGPPPSRGRGFRRRRGRLVCFHALPGRAGGHGGCVELPEVHDLSEARREGALHRHGCAQGRRHFYDEPGGLGEDGAGACQAA